MTVPPKTAAIVGGGITGLAAAYALQTRAAAERLPLRCILIEAAPSFGGKIVTHRAHGFIIEAGPDSFLSTKPWALQLCERLGLQDQLIDTTESRDRAFIYSRGRLRALPEGMVAVAPGNAGALLRSGILSWRGLARMVLDVVIPRKRDADADESLASFFRRRLGREAFDRLVEPLMAGIYAGDAEQISLQAAFPRFAEMERRHGSLIRGIMAATRREGPVHRSLFVTLRGGLQTLVEALIASLEKMGTDILSGTRVTAIDPFPGGDRTPAYRLLLDRGRTVTADALILATPAYASADLLHPCCPAVAALLDGIPYVSTATISLGYRRANLGPRVKGFGFVVPRIERKVLLAATWTSLKWNHRAPPSHALIRCYVGGAGRDSIVAADDEWLVGRVREELRDMAGITEAPLYTEVNRWERGMPQYLVGHLQRMEELQRLLTRCNGLYLAGSAYRGVGIPDCIKDGMEAGERVIEDLFRP